MHPHSLILVSNMFLKFICISIKERKSTDNKLSNCIENLDDSLWKFSVRYKGLPRKTERSIPLTIGSSCERNKWGRDSYTVPILPHAHSTEEEEGCREDTPGCMQPLPSNRIRLPLHVMLNRKFRNYKN